MDIPRKTRHEGGFLLIIVLISTVVGTIVSYISGDYSVGESFLRGGTIGFSISFFCAIGDLIFLQWFKRFPFTIYLLVKTLYFTIISLAVIIISYIFIKTPQGNSELQKDILFSGIVITLSISFLVSFLQMLNRMLGQTTLFNLFVGRYHKPVEEERIFMFLDIASSTEIAEQIGHLKFHTFLNDFFYDITEAILLNGGEIYKYVGDEIIISWKISDKPRNNNPINTFFEIRQVINQKSEKYIRTFGYVPHFRVGIHCGVVVVGEIGDFRREIAFLGDTVNTASRIQGSCKKFGKDLIVSEEVLKRVFLTDQYDAISLGKIQLRGKEKTVELFSIEDSSQFHSFR
ncbi:MAG: adenylate/guanylate cyclase domain-containing protein [Proteobacteria bacterium]|nr:adenylate/guanylate cyclase domain-containing protein [Pseudomonadota bacterium]